jgi:tetratricopeptide (TPR) repeat protein
LTAVAFRWPPGLADWLFPRETTAAEIAKPTEARLVIPAATLAAIRMQADAGDYPGAWKQVTDALRSAPDSAEGLQLEAQTAMGWIRKRFGYEESALVDTLSPSLYRAASSGDKQLAADAHAHIGWGNYLKSRAGTRLDWEAPLKRAIGIDADNTYAHAMWGYIMLWTDLARFDAAMAHFDSALKSGRERAYIRELQLATLAQQRFDDHVLDLIKVVDEMRRGGETLSTKMRDVILSHAYQGNWEVIRVSINSSSPVLGPAEHLATIEWLAAGGKPLHPYGQFFVARLKEQTGDRSAALAIYRAMSAVENPGMAYTRLASEIKEGIARCTM